MAQKGKIARSIIGFFKDELAQEIRITASPYGGVRFIGPGLASPLWAETEDAAAQAYLAHVQMRLKRELDRLEQGTIGFWARLRNWGQRRDLAQLIAMIDDWAKHNLPD